MARGDLRPEGVMAREYREGYARNLHPLRIRDCPRHREISRASGRKDAASVGKESGTKTRRSCTDERGAHPRANLLDCESPAANRRD
jgi:hypothetical protein